MLQLVARATALPLGAFALINAALRLVSPTFDANGWLVDLRRLPDAVAQPLLFLAGGLLIGFACAPRGADWRRKATVAVAMGLAAAAAVNAGTYFALLFSGGLHAGPPLPFSLPIAAGLALIACAASRPREPRRGEALAVVPLAAAAVGLASLGVMVQFGKTDYRRPADAIVVLGARAYADGRPSDALADRVRTACELYHQGHAPLLIMSGGPGDGEVHETEAMREFAVSLGVPRDAIVLDPAGTSTRWTVVNTASIFADRGIGRVLVVSHFYHLPRIKMGYERAGVRAFTVPAAESYTLTKMPLFMLREVVAFWFYYATPHRVAQDAPAGTSNTTT